jgi:hypothetical protein
VLETAAIALSLFAYGSGLGLRAIDQGDGGDGDGEGVAEGVGDGDGREWAASALGAPRNWSAPPNTPNTPIKITIANDGGSRLVFVGQTGSMDASSLFARHEESKALGLLRYSP